MTTEREYKVLVVHSSNNSDWLYYVYRQGGAMAFASGRTITQGGAYRKGSRVAKRDAKNGGKMERFVKIVTS
jgi:hypothetical protein